MTGATQLTVRMAAMGGKPTLAEHKGSGRVAPKAAFGDRYLRVVGIQVVYLCAAGYTLDEHVGFRCIGSRTRSAP